MDLDRRYILTQIKSVRNKKLNFPLVDNFPVLSLYIFFTAMTTFELARVFLHKNHKIF